MRQPGGYVTIVEPGVPITEIDTTTCFHCGAVIFVKPHTASTIYLIPTSLPGRYVEEAGAGCWVCGRAVCLPCHDRGTCTPLEHQLARAEQASR